jgi:hypothetical protein
VFFWLLRDVLALWINIYGLKNHRVHRGRRETSCRSVISVYSVVDNRYLDSFYQKELKSFECIGAGNLYL